MTTRKPLVQIGGSVQELPTGDTIEVTAGTAILSIVTRASTVTSITLSSGGILPVLQHDGSTTTNVTVA